ncbi:MAG TPA: ABC transporter permease [Kofleriaceae bacterium]|nr:ABC transporter permease [Kofleriaceae bacterium]
MIDIDNWQEVWATLSRHKLRTALTALGVMWGVFMMMATIGFARGFRDGMTRQMSWSATNSVYVWAQRTTMAYEGLQPGRPIQFHNDDIAAVARVPGIEYLAPRIQMGGWQSSNNVTRGNKTGNFQVFGDFSEMRHINNMSMTAGRFLDPLDLSEQRKVAIIGKSVYDILFKPGEDPVGQYVRVRGAYFQVVGMFEARGSGDDRERQQSMVIIPFTTFQQAFNFQNKVDYFALTVLPNRSAPAVEKEVKRVLAERHKIHPDDPEGIGSFNWAERFNKFQMVFMSIEVFAWIASVLTLLAGVLGVSNILLIAIKERTQEIGIRKALGARPGVLVRMVVQESVVLTAVAGYFGLVAGVALLEVASLFISGDGQMAKPQVDFGTAILSVVILVGSGALAGVIPARHAARIPPVEALRAE